MFWNVRLACKRVEQVAGSAMVSSSRLETRSAATRASNTFGFLRRNKARAPFDLGHLLLLAARFERNSNLTSLLGQTAMGQEPKAAKSQEATGSRVLSTLIR